jgi:hypothetical protein
MAVVAREQQWLEDNGRPDLAPAVRHVSLIEGDGAGYDVASFNLDGSDRFIEVKTTRGGPETDFYISANEVAFSTKFSAAYALYRVYDFEPESGRGKYWVKRGCLAEEPSVTLEPVQFVVRLSGPAQVP